MKKVKILAPKIPRALPVNNEFDHIDDEDEIRGLEIQDACMKYVNAYNISFRHAVIRNSEFIDCSLGKFDATDVVFEDCDLSNIDFSYSIFHRVHFRRCKIIGANLRDTTFENVVFEGCNLNYTNLRFSSFKSCKIMDSSLVNTDLQSSKFNKLLLESNDLRQAQMSGTKLKDIDISENNIDGLGIALEDMKGAIISPVQSLYLSRLAGLIIKE